MGRGWRRAFCTSVQGDPEPLTTKEEEEQQQRSRTVKLGAIFSSNSNSSSTPSTPRGLKVLVPNSPKTPQLHCKTTPTPMPLSMNNAVNNNNNNNKNQSCIGNKESSPSPRLLFQSSSSPSGTRSPSRFALFKTAFRLSKSRCGLCAGSVKSGGDDRTAVFTAECSHVFHFPCISNHVRTQACLVCPVCSVTWQQVPLLSSALPHKSSSSSSSSSHDDIALEDRRGRHQGGGTAACKVYNDDESLQSSPTCGGSPCGTQMQFNPIPEEDDRDIDEDCQEGEEDGKQLENKQEGDDDDGDVRIRFVPEAMALLSTERAHQSYVVAIKIKAPSIPPRAAMAACNDNKNSKKNRAAAAAPPMALPASLLEPACRAPIDLVTVLDASGSMTPPKLQMLKRAMRLVISSLGPGDRLSIVAFSAVAAKRLLPLRRMSRQGQRAARQIVDRLVGCGGSQNQNQKQSSSNSSSSSRMGDALRKATKVLEDRRERNPVATIMLLSDGHAQQQQQAPQDGRQQQTHSSSSPVTATRFAHLEIPIHASTSPFIQQKQSGNMSSVQVDQNDDAFAKCVNGLVSVVLQDVHLKFAFSSGYISSVFSFPTADGLGTGQDAIVHGEGGRSVRLGDLYADEERQLLVELRVPKAAIVSHHSASALSISVSCSYRDPVTRNLIECGERPLSLMPMLLPYQSQSHHPTLLRSSSSSSSSFSAMTTAATTQAEQQLLRNLFVTTRAMAESRRLVGLNHLDTAIHLLSSARSLILQQSKNIASHKKFLVCLETELTELQRQQLQRQQQQHQQQQSLSPSQRRRSEQAVLLAEARSGSGEDPLTPTSAWRAAEQLAKVAIMRKSLNRVSDLHGLENARF